MDRKVEAERGKKQNPNPTNKKSWQAEKERLKGGRRLKADDKKG